MKYRRVLISIPPGDLWERYRKAVGNGSAAIVKHMERVVKRAEAPAAKP